MFGAGLHLAISNHFECCETLISSGSIIFGGKDGPDEPREPAPLARWLGSGDSRGKGLTGSGRAILAGATHGKGGVV